MRTDTKREPWDEAFEESLHFGCIDEVRARIIAGQSVNYRGGGGTPPICVAAMYGYIEMASMLLDLGATTDLWDLQSGKTALMIAVQHRDISFVRLLLTRGAAVDTPSLPYEEIAGGRTALMIACNVGSIELVDLLLASGANPNARDEANMTPLHYTVPVRGHEPPQVDEPTAMSMASRLLSAGANVSRRDFSGETAADDAMKVEYKELAELLKCPEPPKQRRAHCGLITPGLPCGSDVWRDDTD